MNGSPEGRGGGQRGAAQPRLPHRTPARTSRSPYPSRLAGLLRGAAEAAGAGGRAGEIRRLRLLDPARDSPKGQGQSPRPQQFGTAPRGHHCGPLQCCAGPGTPCPHTTPSRTLDPHVTLSLACPCPHSIPSLRGPSPMQSCPHVSCHHTNLSPFHVSLCHPPSCQLASKPPKWCCPIPPVSVSSSHCPVPVPIPVPAHPGVTLSLSCTMPVSSSPRVTLMSPCPHVILSWSHLILVPPCPLATPSPCLPVPMYSCPSATPFQCPPVPVSPIPVLAAGPVWVPPALGGAVCGAGAVGGCGAVPTGRRRQ